ncbi:nitroreductase family protein [Hafnia alvei]|nr:malonic semialdehyde reductase [Hafnia alvei]
MNSIYDYLKFKKFYTKASGASKDKQKLESWILQDKHRIEKAFTLPEPRYGFGKEVIPRLIENLVQYRQEFGPDKVYYIGVGSLNAYMKYHADNIQELPDFYSDNIIKIPVGDFKHQYCELSGYSRYAESTISTESDASWFIQNRRSCRNFDFEKSKNINDEILSRIVKLSIMAPSVCNRQHWRVHFFSGDKKNAVLNFQNGNAGFQENIPFIAIVTSDLRAFYSHDERNQPYTDGGIFSMNLMYAMQSNGLASCPLNWCNSARTESRFRKLNLIPDNEVIILILAFGYPSKDALYAKSPRLPVDNFFTIHP